MDVGGEVESDDNVQIGIEVGGEVCSRDGRSVGKYFKGGVDVIIDDIVG